MSEAIKLTTDGILLNWLKAVGDTVKAGDIIANSFQPIKPLLRSNRAPMA